MNTMENKICTRCGMQYPDHKMSCKIPVESYRLPKAEEFLQNSLTISHFYNDEYDRMMCYSNDVENAMIQFAKFHVEQAEKAWFEKIKSENLVTDSGIAYLQNAYPLENIK